MFNLFTVSHNSKVIKLTCVSFTGTYTILYIFTLFVFLGPFLFSPLSPITDKGVNSLRISSRLEKRVAGNCRTRHFVRIKAEKGKGAIALDQS